MYFFAASALACDDGDGAEVAASGAAALVDASSPLGAEAGRDPPPRTDARRFSHMAPPEAGRARLSRSRRTPQLGPSSATPPRVARVSRAQASARLRVPTSSRKSGTGIQAQVRPARRRTK